MVSPSARHDRLTSMRTTLATTVKIFLTIILTFTSIRTSLATPAPVFGSPQVRTGQVALVKISKSAEQGLSATSGTKAVALFPCPSEASGTESLCALLGAPADGGSKALDLTLHWNDERGPQTASFSLPVVPATYPETKLKVNPKLTNPSARDQARIVRELEEVKAAFAAASPQPLWQDTFRRPT